MKKWKRVLISLSSVVLLAGISGGIANVLNASNTVVTVVMYGEIPLIVVVLVPWIVEGDWIWNLLRERRNR